jgi:CRP/FNR family nitrogen fixation transcriptional regulator
MTGSAAMLVRINSTSRNPIEGHFAALAGERAFSSEFKYRRRTEIFGEGEEPEYVYQIISGAVRTYKLLADGRCQINSFHLPGDMFGFENGKAHHFSAEALVETKVRIMRQWSLLDTLERRDGSRTNLLRLVTQSLQHAENHMLLLGRKTAIERVAAFILEMDERQDHPSMMVLPMSRRDIADYLGLTIETVSRAFSILRDERLLRFVGKTQRQLELLDRPGIARHDA